MYTLLEKSSNFKDCYRIDEEKPYDQRGYPN